MPLANTNPDLPGEFSAGPGLRADNLGIPANLPAGMYPQVKPGDIPGKPYTPSDERRAIVQTDPLDPAAFPNPSTG